jgi:hypothetical protein
MGESIRSNERWRSAFVGAAFRHFGLLAFLSFLACQPLSDRSRPSGITEM